MTAILLFARDLSAIRHVQVAECGFGVADMGNKGAVGLRIAYTDAGGTKDGSGSHRTTELTFVATHLAPMEWNLDRRNANWRSIMSGLTFKNPKTIVEGLDGLGRGLEGRPLDSAASEPRTPEERELSEWLLSAEQEDELAEHHDTLRDISIFRPASYLFVAGDLNYRIGDRTPPMSALFPSLDDGPQHWSHFLDRDQLTRERLARRAFHGMSEADVRFPPTYKYDVLPQHHHSQAGGEEEPDALASVPWRFAPHRWPSWCDRVLYLDVPAWAGPRAGHIDVRAYHSLPLMRTSDHQPVFFRATVPVLGAAQLALSESEAVGDSDDPRAQLPVPIDVDAWERRAAARRREILVGWSMLLWCTREGAVFIATLLFVGVTSWWLYQGFWSAYM